MNKTNRINRVTLIAYIYTHSKTLGWRDGSVVWGSCYTCGLEFGSQHLCKMLSIVHTSVTPVTRDQSRNIVGFQPSQEKTSLRFKDDREGHPTTSSGLKAHPPAHTGTHMLTQRHIHGCTYILTPHRWTYMHINTVGFLFQNKRVMVVLHRHKCINSTHSYL